MENQFNKTCILSLDQGTTSSRAILFDRRGTPLAMAQQEFPPQQLLLEAWVVSAVEVVAAVVVEVVAVDQV